MKEHDPSQVSILLVEDDHGHARLIEMNLRRAGVSNPIIHCDNGQKAVDFLVKESNDREGRPLQLIVLLDLVLPVLDGYEVLKTIKNNERTKSIPVIVLTTTDDPSEVSRCYQLGCNLFITKPVEYITKPVHYETFSSTIQVLGNFLARVRTPGRV